MLRAGIVGSGFVAAIHVDALRRLGVEVKGVVGSSPSKLRPRGSGASSPACA
jgi:predicted dehydrogenase